MIGRFHLLALLSAWLLIACAAPVQERRLVVAHANESVPPAETVHGRMVVRDDAGGPASAQAPTARTVRRIELDDDEAVSIDEPEAEDELPPTDESFVCPVAEPSISSPFGMRSDPIRRHQRRMHRGVDFRGPIGIPVYATASGRALMAGWCDRGTGNCIVLQHPHGWRSQYFHLSAVHIRAGQWVQQGQHIGDIGSTGRSTGPHLHFQLGRDGEAIDPMTLIGTRLDQ